MPRKEEKREIKLLDNLEPGSYGAGNRSIEAAPGEVYAVTVNHARIFVNSGNFEYVNPPDPTVLATDIPEDVPQREKLVEAGLDSVEKIKQADDERILSIEGIGDATLANIKAATKKAARKTNK